MFLHSMSLKPLANVFDYFKSNYYCSLHHNCFRLCWCSNSLRMVIKILLFNIKIITGVKIGKLLNLFQLLFPRKVPISF